MYLHLLSGKDKVQFLTEVFQILKIQQKFKTLFLRATIEHIAALDLSGTTAEKSAHRNKALGYPTQLLNRIFKPFKKFAI